MFFYLKLIFKQQFQTIAAQKSGRNRTTLNIHIKIPHFLRKFNKTTKMLPQKQNTSSKSKNIQH